MKQTQSERILKYLNKGGSLTVLKALKLFGCYALSQRVGELRREGFPIGTRMVKLRNGKWVAKYTWMANVIGRKSCM